MKIFKRVLKGLFWMLIVFLLVLPLGLLYKVSTAEMKEYEAPESPQLRQISIGAVCQAYRQDIREFVSLDGTFTSRETAFMKLDCKNPSEIRWVAAPGEELFQGQILGYYKDKPVTSEMDGILEEIHDFSASDAYLKIRCFEPLELEAQVDEKTLSALKRGAEKLCLENDSAVVLKYASKIMGEDGNYTVRLMIGQEGYSYGQKLEKLKIYTGGSYPQVLVLDADCIYQKKKGEDEPWYARKVTQDGYFIEEVPVTVSYSNGEVACVTGISEGECFDTGYKKVVEGESE